MFCIYQLNRLQIKKNSNLYEILYENVNILAWLIKTQYLQVLFRIVQFDKMAKPQVINSV